MSLLLSLEKILFSIHPNCCCYGACGNYSAFSSPVFKRTLVYILLIHLLHYVIQEQEKSGLDMLRYGLDMLRRVD